MRDHLQFKEVHARAGALAAAVGVGVGASAWATAPTYTAHPSHHAPDTTSRQALRCVGSSSPPKQNPGVRVFPNFLSSTERGELLAELQPIKQHYGLNLIGPREGAVYKWQQGGLANGTHTQRLPPVNMLRITGRPESERQRLAPWRYGDDFDESQLPPKLATLAQRIRAIPGLSLGPLRDVTINYRHSGFLRLDPHVDPALDGENVFVLGVDSDTVLTLCPVERLKLWRWLCTAWDALRFRDERERVVQEAHDSWTPWDVDVLTQACTLVHLSGDARWAWTHGTRVGLPVKQDQVSKAATASKSNVRISPYSLHDFWGLHSALVARGVERHSVVFAFGEGPPQALSSQ